MRNVFVFICILLCVSSCHAEDYKEDEDNTIGDISIWNYPVTRTNGENGACPPTKSGLIHPLLS